MSVMNEYEKSLFDDPLISMDSIAMFRGLTSMENPGIGRMMKGYEDRITPEQFSSLCESFANGLDYIQAKYDIQPSSVMIGSLYDTTSATVDSLVVRLPLEYLCKVQETPWGFENKTDPFFLSPNDAMMIRGVEEGFHVVQSVMNPEQMERFTADTTVSPYDDSPDAYRDYNYKQPVEYDAMIEVREAMLDLGVAERSPVRPNGKIHNEDISWASDVLARRTTPHHVIDTATAEHQVPQVVAAVTQVQ